MAKYRFNLALGDYYGEGHGLYKEYLAVADKPIEDVREAHAKIMAKTGIDLSGFASEYKDTRLPDEVHQRLLDLGYEFGVELYKDDVGYHLLEDGTMCDCPEELARIWIFLLNQVDPELHCVLEHEDDLPALFAEPGKSSIGYGLF